MRSVYPSTPNVSRLSVNGLGGLAQFSIDPSNFSDTGRDYGWGMGVTIGWVGRLMDTLTMGAAYSPRVAMSEN